MKSVPNLISYLHKVFWNFYQFLAIFELFSSGGNFNTEIADMKGLTCQLPLSVPGPPISAPSPHGCHTPASCRSCALRALSGLRVGVPTALPTAPPAVRAVAVASRAPVSTASSSMSEADRPCPSAPPSLSGRLRRRELVHGERCPSPLLPLFLPWSVEPTSLSLLPIAGPPPATRALASSENAAADKELR
jgi:hypothetical protein